MTEHDANPVIRTEQWIRFDPLRSLIVEVRADETVVVTADLMSSILTGLGLQRARVTPNV